MSDDVALGDVTVETTFADYRDVDGVRLPMRLTTKTDRYVTADLKVSGATINGSTVDLSAPQSVTSSAGPPPYAPKVTAQEVSKGIWLLAGEGHHSVLVELSDHTELIEVPLNETRAIAVIAKARDVVRDKPLRKVIVTHHHFDHTAGVRAAVAEGLTLVAHQSNRTILEDLSRRPHTIVPDTLSRHPRPMKLETVGDRTVIADPLTPMEMYHVQDDAHSDTSLMVYFPTAKILVQADLFSTHFLTQPSAPSLLDNITKRRLDVRTHVPLHGEIRSHEEFTKLAQAAAAH
jgi:glyoxylase-like metal-dependent hydrolase (beta-lactamase superfamily II)